ncbi:MAG: DUF2442 domain-containing protein [Pseudomonas sp.]
MNPRVTRVTVLSPYKVELWFNDGSHGDVDLAPWILGARGVFAALQDPAFFSQVAVDREAGTIVWPNGADLDPDVLFEAAQADATIGQPDHD